MQLTNQTGDLGNNRGNHLSRLSRTDFPNLKGKMFKVGFINVNRFLIGCYS